MRRLAVNALEAACGLLDRIPTWSWYEGGVHRVFGGWGCRLGIARRAVELDERWGTGVWGKCMCNKQCPDCGRYPCGYDPCECKCHCGKSAAIVSDPPMYETLGPAARALCEDCLPLRCDAYPGACR